MTTTKTHYTKAEIEYIRLYFADGRKITQASCQELKQSINTALSRECIQARKVAAITTRNKVALYKACRRICLQAEKETNVNAEEIFAKMTKMNENDNSLPQVTLPTPPVQTQEKIFSEEDIDLNSSQDDNEDDTIEIQVACPSVTKVAPAIINDTNSSISISVDLIIQLIAKETNRSESQVRKVICMACGRVDVAIKHLQGKECNDKVWSDIEDAMLLLGKPIHTKSQEEVTIRKQYMKY